MADSRKPVVVELGIEFVVELLLFLYPYGADQMNLPHNFWLGLGCWIVGTAIAIRMFWIFPAWSSRLTRLEKGLISLIAVAGFVGVFYGPVVAAHSKRNRDSEATPTTQQPIEREPHKTPNLPADAPVKPIPAATPRKVPSRIESNPISAPSKVAGHGSVGVSGDKIPAIGGITQGAGSALLFNQQGGITAGTINLGPPPLPKPTIKVCLAHPPTPEGQLHSTVITLRTDVQITRPWFFFFFDGPVESGSVSMDGAGYGCNCPLRAEKMPNPERSFGFRTTSINFGTNVWFPKDGVITATVPSKDPVNLVKVLSGGGDNPDVGLPENLLNTCD